MPGKVGQSTSVNGEIQRVVVIGAGSAGLLAALALKRAFDHFDVCIVHSRQNPVIGVGESTTAIFPPFLHRSLGLDVGEFFRAVQPSWKLGIRFEWGDPDNTHFNYPFDRAMSFQPTGLSRLPSYFCLSDMQDASPFSARMDRGKSPCRRDRNGAVVVEDGIGYHIDNPRFLTYLMSKATECGITTMEGVMERVERSENGNVTSLQLEGDRQVEGDLFVDASGFRSLLLDKEMGTPFESYGSSLFCDTAVVGQWKREGPILPFTRAETMNHGWCWQIDFPYHVSRGYVFCSRFCDLETATQEFRAKNPQLERELRTIRFRSGRYRDFWVRNVVGIGNASGFVEPLEASALHVLVEQIRLVCRLLSEGNRRIVPALRQAGNQRFRELWNEVRDFLAIHYRFNRKLDTPFWQQCRADTDLAGAAELVKFYQAVGPSTFAGAMIASGRIFGYDGFMTLLIGQKVATEFEARLSDSEIQAWIAYRARLREQCDAALPMEEALPLVLGPR